MHIDKFSVLRQNRLGVDWWALQTGGLALIKENAPFRELNLLGKENSPFEPMPQPARRISVLK